MTQEDFIDAYAARSGGDRAEIMRECAALPCTCGDDMCAGWAMVGRHYAVIGLHAAQNGLSEADVGRYAAAT